tara:strand:+ start:871 stop:1275 length:405 start_codon:yes stop_codon:yes gene_type:complete
MTSKLKQPVFILCFSFMAVFARADESVDYYVTVISEQDRQDSLGNRLTKFEQVIRQDRANFHKYGMTDEGDEEDDLFSSATSRANLESYLKKGSTPDAVKKQILSGRELYVAVSIWKKADGVIYAKVGLYGNTQ